jgi:hypothetical protein
MRNNISWQHRIVLSNGAPEPAAAMQPSLYGGVLAFLRIITK